MVGPLSFSFASFTFNPLSLKIYLSECSRFSRGKYGKEGPHSHHLKVGLYIFSQTLPNDFEASRLCLRKLQERLLRTWRFTTRQQRSFIYRCASFSAFNRLRICTRNLPFHSLQSRCISCSFRLHRCLPLCLPSAPDPWRWPYAALSRCVLHCQSDLCDNLIPIYFSWKERNMY